MGPGHHGPLFLGRLARGQGHEDQVGRLAVDLDMRRAASVAWEVTLCDAGCAPLSSDQSGERGGDQELSRAAHVQQLQGVTRGSGRASNLP